MMLAVYFLLALSFVLVMAVSLFPVNGDKGAAEDKQDKEQRGSLK